ncbi:MAG: hypothetical protein KDD47_26160, partial [Acidobacteria bacterium]|nr:hypothetical protein [Acidobacteriota bacterium]
EETEVVEAAEEMGEVEVWDAEPGPQALESAAEDLLEDQVAEPEPAALETVQPPTPEGLQTLRYPLPTMEESAAESVEDSGAATATVSSMTDDGYPEPDETVLLSRPPSLAPPAPAQDFDGDETHPGLSAGAPAPPSAAEPESSAAGRSGRASEVAPPSDVEGPGWAFAERAQPVSDEDARHETAKRLARLLVSEIKLYNEEQVAEGQLSNDIYERLKEDIDRSRQMYEERVDEQVRATNDYFYQELVRTLAAGNPRALGI